MSFIAGYISTLQVDGVDVHLSANDATLSLTNETLDKTVLGVTNRTYITGLQDGTVDISTHTNTDSASALQTAFSSTVPVTFVFRPGKLGAGFDAGQWAGTAIITSMDIVGAVDDNWATNLSLQITGVVTYTAPA